MVVGLAGPLVKGDHLQHHKTSLKIQLSAFAGAGLEGNLGGGDEAPHI